MKEYDLFCHSSVATVFSCLLFKPSLSIFHNNSGSCCVSLSHTHTHTLSFSLMLFRQHIQLKRYFCIQLCVFQFHFLQMFHRLILFFKWISLNLSSLSIFSLHLPVWVYFLLKSLWVVLSVPTLYETSSVRITLFT